MNDTTNDTMNDTTRKGFSLRQVLLAIVLTLVVAVVATYFVLARFVFLKEFSPVSLNDKEQRTLDDKLRAIGVEPDQTRANDSETAQDQDTERAGGKVQPERYTESAGMREINFTEKELNSLLAHNTNLSKRMAIDLADDLASAKILIPMEPDFPIVGGKTIRINTGMELSFSEERPVVILKGVSIMGVPIPNAWLGNLKNVDLVREFGLEGGFWKAFSDGVEFIEVREGKLQIKLKE